MSAVAKLISLERKELEYDVLGMDFENGVFELEDPDTGKTFNWCPVNDKKQCLVLFRRLGFELVDVVDD